MRAQAEVRASRTEGDVVVRPARHVEPVRVVEDLLVAVRADVPRDHLVAGLDRLPAELVVLGRRAPEVQHGRRPPQDLLGRGPDQGRVVPEELQLLRDQPELIPNATEEILRWATPVLHFRRTATCDVELRGQHIKAGDKVVTWYVSANRDPEMFDDPYTFDVTRKPNEHVTFGPGGPHFCLGAHLARLETKILFQELIPRLDSIELTGPVQRIRSNFVNGIKRMPVRVVTT